MANSLIAVKLKVRNSLFSAALKFLPYKTAHNSNLKHSIRIINCAKLIELFPFSAAGRLLNTCAVPNISIDDDDHSPSPLTIGTSRETAGLAEFHE